MVLLYVATKVSTLWGLSNSITAEFVSRDTFKFLTVPHEVVRAVISEKLAVLGRFDNRTLVPIILLDCEMVVGAGVS
jgi:hypothetical protein